MNPDDGEDVETSTISRGMRAMRDGRPIYERFIREIISDETTRLAIHIFPGNGRKDREESFLELIIQSIYRYIWERIRDRSEFHRSTMESWKIESIFKSFLGNISRSFYLVYNYTRWIYRSINRDPI